MHLGTLLIVFFVLAIVGVSAVVLQTKAGRGDVGQSLKGKPFLTPNELEFLVRLETAVPELRFHAQVSMGALLAPVVSKQDDARAHMSARGSFSQKIVDFVAQDKRTGNIVAIIELDDKTHNVAKDKERDSMLRQGSYKVIRWESRSKPNGQMIRGQLLPTNNAMA